MARRDTEVSCLVKYLLFFFNVFFWLIGGVVLGVGIWARLEKTGVNVKDYSGWDLDPAYLLIVVGALMFLLGFCGCIGALRENVCLLKFFSISLSIIFFMQLTAGVLGFVFRYKVQGLVAKRLEDTITKYRDNVNLQNLIDYSQTTFRCCGLLTFDDWEKNIYFNCSSAGSEACGVPYSCCRIDKINTMCGYGIRQSNVTTNARVSRIYVRGCIDGVSAWFKEHLVVVGGVGIGVALLQILGIAFATSLISDIRRQMAKWDHPLIPPPMHSHI